jgi:hypothetical protein
MAQTMLLVVLFGVPQVFAADIQRTVSFFVSQAREVEIERYSSNAAIARPTTRLYGCDAWFSPRSC